MTSIATITISVALNISINQPRHANRHLYRYCAIILHSQLLQVPHVNITVHYRVQPSSPVVLKSFTKIRDADFAGMREWRTNETQRAAIKTVSGGFSDVPVIITSPHLASFPSHCCRRVWMRNGEITWRYVCKCKRAKNIQIY